MIIINVKKEISRLIRRKQNYTINHSKSSQLPIFEIGYKTIREYFCYSILQSICCIENYFKVRYIKVIYIQINKISENCKSCQQPIPLVIEDIQQNKGFVYSIGGHKIMYSIEEQSGWIQEFHGLLEQYYDIQLTETGNNLLCRTLRLFKYTYEKQGQVIIAQHITTKLIA